MRGISCLAKHTDTHTDTVRHTQTQTDTHIQTQADTDSGKKGQKRKRQKGTEAKTTIRERSEDFPCFW